MDASLSQRIERLEAREDIRRLVARYGMAVDDRDLETVGALFTEDAVFRHGEDSLVNNGRQEILAFYEDRLSAFGATFHYPNSHIIDFESDQAATGIVMAHAELAMNDATFVVALRYHDTYRREDGTWRFAERQIKMLYFMDLAEFAAGGLAETDRKRYFGDIGPTEIPEMLPTWVEFFAGR